RDDDPRAPVAAGRRQRRSARGQPAPRAAHRGANARPSVSPRAPHTRDVAHRRARGGRDPRSVPAPPRPGSGVMRGRLLFVLFAEFARIDAGAMALGAPDVDPDFREPRILAGEPDAVGTRARRELPPV